MLLAEKFTEIFLKHKGYFFISESFALSWHIFVALTNKKLFDLEKLIEYWASAVSLVSSNPCVEPLPYLKYLFSCDEYAYMSSYQFKK